MTYSCDSCGSSMVYDPEKKKLICPHCGRMRTDMPKGEETDGSVCPACGAPLQGTERALVCQCPYCGTWLSIDPNLRDADAPKKILPFAFSKDQARQRVIDAFDNVPFLPGNFLADPEGKDIQAVYAPFWLYPAFVTRHYEYRAELVLPHGSSTEHQRYYLSGTTATLPEKPRQDPEYRQRAADWACMSADAKEEDLTQGYTSVRCTSRYGQNTLPADPAPPAAPPAGAAIQAEEAAIRAAAVTAENGMAERYHHL